ncbi:MAG: ATP-binding protein [Elusimicrobia bacterium]|nr:ATP-binding protein [Elusimicrobiota bacterium]
MKSLTDYWRTKFTELQKQFSDEKKNNNVEKKEQKDKIFEHQVTIKELQTKITELEKNISGKVADIEQLKKEKKSSAEKQDLEKQNLANEIIENIHLTEKKKNIEIQVLISEFVRFLRKDVGHVSGHVRVLTEICKEKEAQAVINDLIEYTEWMTLMAEELSWFSQPFKKESGTSKIDTAIDELLPDFKRPISKNNIEISKDISEGIPDIPVFQEHLKTVFSEIMKNSIDAMPSGGSITIKAYVSDKNVVIEFKDTGRGIPLHLIEKVTRPFFSTKKKIGFGFGTTKARIILDTYDSHLDINSIEGEGTVVKVVIPVTIS